jgi:PAS domain S-box-containing protein
VPKHLGSPFASGRRSLGDSNRQQMSTTALDVDSRERASPPGAGVLDLAQYTLEQVRRDTELVLFRGLRSGDEEGSRSSILVQVPVADPPAPATVRSLQEEYALRSELDPAYVVRSLALVQDHGRPMLILEDPLGRPLDLLLNGAMDIAQFLRLAIRVGAALGHVHSRGLVHKDIKPANILVNVAGDQAWLMGFGTASRLPRERQSGQIPEYLVGTLSYMAPEQTGRMNRSIDSRSDLYSLGVTFYEMLTGTLPFTASDPMELVHCHIARQPTPPCEKVNGVPRAVSAIVMKLLAKTAEERYQTAAGLESDLRRSLNDWETKHRIGEFLLGEHDTPDRLLIPEKLYGRESEIDALLAAFDRVVAGGKPELVLVSGYSGIGKSSVVNELHKSLVPPRGLFASGKFDQYKRDVPYATLAQAFQNLVQRLLGKSEADLAPWRDSLRDALGPNGRLIIDLVPELELIVGQQPPAPDLPPHDARRRFQLTFRRFIGVFARPEHPLALFLDDLQWLDAATLDLLEDLSTGSDLQHLMLIGAYRANELASAHSLRQKLEAIETAGGKIVQITLAPLAPEHLQQLISEALRCEMERAAPLAQLVHEKTGGNPFFANRFIASLAEEGMLTFDRDAGRWSWDLGRIRAKGYTDNLADLMVGKLTRLAAETQKAVQQLACVGNAAPVATLSLVYGTTETEIHSLLADAVRADLLERRKDSYHFSHDRIQEAAYLLVPESVRAEAHLRIGRLLAANTPPERREGAIYEIVNQLNRGAPLITSDPEREQLAELNLIAGKRAKAATAYGSALNYLVAGEALLPEDCWERRYPLVFAMEVNRAEYEFLTGDLAAAEERLSTLSLRAANLVDKATVACLRTALYTTLTRADRAVEICVEYLREAGIACSPHPSDEDVRQEYERLWAQLGSRPIEALFDLPLMDDPDWRATMEVLTELSAPAYFSDMNLWCLVLLRMANLSAEHGNCDGSCYAYGYMNTVAGARFGNYRAGLRFGMLSLDLVEKKGLERFKSRVCHACGCVVIPWERHIRAGVPLLRRSLETALETGDQTYAAYAHCDLVSNRLTSADPLNEVQREAESALEFAQKARFGLNVDVVTGQLGLIRTLRGLTPVFGSFCDDGFDEGRFEQHLEASPSRVACWYWVRKLQARFYAGNCAQAVAAAAKARSLLKAASGVIEEADYHFYAALTRATASDSATPDERREYSAALAEHHKRLALWAETCAENFADRAALVGAEIARLDGRELEAERLYEQAIRAAREQRFIQNEGLAYELAARFYAARGFEAFADLYLRRARHCYQRWGADGKVRQLTELCPRLRENEIDSKGTSGAPIEQLELATVLKVSQAVSGEMILDRLLDRLMRAAIEHAGAERGLLIARRGDELQIQAQAIGADVTVNLRDSDHTEAALPQSLVRYVMRTRDTVILEDASAQNLFSADPYLVQHRARSILCLPLINQGNLIGVLYLENNLAPRVFGPARIAVLKLLASQAAMSLENTRLYRDLAKREARIRRLVYDNVVGIQFWDLDGTILEANDAFLRIVGYEREDLVSGRLRWTDLTPAQWRGRDRQEVVAEMQRTGTLQPFEWEYVRKDGSRVPVLAGAAGFEGETQGVGFVLDLTERKRVEQALRQSEAYLADAQRLAHMGSWAYDYVLGKVKHYSDEAFRLYGLDPRRPSGPPQLEETRQLIHPGDRERVFEQLAQIFRDKVEYEQQYRIVLPDGTVRHLLSIGHPVVDQSGELVEYFGTVMDVSERRHAEHRLIVQHRVTRILAEAATVEEAIPKILEMIGEWPGWDLGVMWQNDRHAGVLRCTKLWRTPSLEAAQFEAVTRTMTFSPGRGLPGRVWASGAPAHIPDVTRDPNFPRADIAAREGLHGAFAFPILLGSEVLGVIEFFSRDVWQADQYLLDMMATIGSQIGQFTKRAAAVNELRLRVNMLQHIPVAAWSVTPDGTPDIVNQLWFEYTGQTPEFVNSYREAWMSTIHPEERERASRIYLEGIRSGRGFTMEARFLRASDGTYRWHLNRAVAVRDPEGNILRFVGTSTDVHDLRQTQEELRNTQAEFGRVTRVVTMGELTASIAHEVNQPLGAMVTSAASCARWLAAKPPQMDKARRALERIVNDGRRAGAIIQRIRALMSRRAPRKDWLDVNETILEVIALTQYELRRNDIMLETRLAEGLPRVQGDRVQCQQVLLNLIVNAIEAMSEIGQRRRELTIVSATDGPDAVRVEVRDTGTGLDPERAAQLFEPFYTTKAAGLGIGLSISRSIVEAHGGRLTAGANAPHGAVFCIWLPVEEPMA